MRKLEVVEVYWKYARLWIVTNFCEFCLCQFSPFVHGTWYPSFYLQLLFSMLPVPHLLLVSLLLLLLNDPATSSNGDRSSYYRRCIGDCTQVHIRRCSCCMCSTGTWRTRVFVNTNHAHTRSHTQKLCPLEDTEKTSSSETTSSDDPTLKQPRRPPPPKTKALDPDWKHPSRWMRFMQWDCLSECKYECMHEYSSFRWDRQRDRER